MVRWCHGEAKTKMLDLLKEVAHLGYLDAWPTEGEDLFALLRGIDGLRKGAIWAGIRSLEEVTGWHPLAAKLLAKYVSEDVLLNTAAELYHNAFERNSRLLLVLGSLLGPAALAVPAYFAVASRFVTRVVGLRYGERCRELAALKPGMPVYLVREPENRCDPNAVAVFAPWGRHLGYLRAPLAAALSARCAAGEAFAARVAAVLGPGCDPNERLHIEVWREVDPEGLVFAASGEPVAGAEPARFPSPRAD